MVLADVPSAGQVMSTAYGSAYVAGGQSPLAGNNAGGSVSAWSAAINTVTSAMPPVAGLPSVTIPLLYGLDAVHGNSGTQGTVIFPHNAGLASSRNAAFVTQVGQIEAQEILAAGINWMFGPFSGTTWDYRWGRVYESFSEDPTWAGEMIQALLIGLQGPGGLGSSTRLMACSKHVAGDGQGAPPSGKGGVVDRGNAVITDAQMEQWGLAQYVPAINSGLGCVMVSDGSWNGNYMTTSSHLITDLLKTKYGFKGFVITDYDSACGAANTVAAVNAGVDMFMTTAGCDASTIMSLNTASAIPKARIDDAVTRILNAKCQAGDFTYKQDATAQAALVAAAGSAPHRAVGRQAVAQSLVLLQNNNTALPIPKTAKVFVGGSGANDLGRQCGGWTITWQGMGGNITTGTTIQAAIAKVAMPAATMADADDIVIVLSEKPYAEFEGDSQTLNTLPPADFTLLQMARATGKKVIAIVLSGRPVLISSAIMNADAWIAGWLPGTEGDGVADVLFGDVKFTGKLSHSWPADDNSANIMCATGYAGKSCPGGYKPEFALGFSATAP
jgi:beta-glucosidase